MTDKYDGSNRCLEGAPAFCGVPTTGAELHREAEACRRCAAMAFGRAPRAGDVPAFGLEHLRDCDTAAAAERGLACVLMSGGHSTAEGMTAYTEPCFLPKDHPLASGGRRLLVYNGDSWREVEAPSEESLTGCAGPEGEAECDNSIDVHP